MNAQSSARTSSHEIEVDEIDEEQSETEVDLANNETLSSRRTRFAWRRHTLGPALSRSSRMLTMSEEAQNWHQLSKRQGRAVDSHTAADIAQVDCDISRRSGAAAVNSPHSDYILSNSRKVIHPSRRQLYPVQRVRHT